MAKKDKKEEEKKKRLDSSVDGITESSDESEKVAAKDSERNKKNGKREKEKEEVEKPGSAREKQEKALLIGLGILVALGLLGWFVARMFFGVQREKQVYVEPTVPRVVEAAEQKYYRYLDGVETIAGRENPLPIGVMIENLASTEVRPQWGLSKASIVYETLAEGGITRFLAVYVDTDAPKIGPIRSARPYYVDFAAENDSLYVHAGGSPEGLAAARKLGSNDVNALSGGGYFLRGAGRAPHNLYTSGELLARYMRDKKLEEEVPSSERWTFADDPALEARPKDEDAKALVIDWSSGSSYDVRYVYDRTSNSYKRFHGDVAHNDRNSEEQIAVKNILIQRVPVEGYYSSGKGRISLTVTGEGSGFVVKNGEIIAATWKKPTQDARLRFYDAIGVEIPLSRGNTWVEVVPGDRDILAE